MNTTLDRPLSGNYVLDFVPGPFAAIGRTLAELGAEVVRIEPLGGQVDRPRAGNRSEVIEFTALNAGKRSAVIDRDNPADIAKLAGMIARASLVLLDASPKAAFPLSPSELRRDRPDLVVMSVSDFGVGNSFSSWSATDPVFLALSSELARSGLTGRAPLVPPARIGLGTSASQGAYVASLALFHAARTGLGGHLDYSALDGASQALDPGYGIGGSAASGTRPSDLPRSRPPRGVFYPILKCKDGHVRICVLSPRQWQSMFAWMGSPAEFADPKFNKLHERFGSTTLNPAIEAFFLTKTRAELELEGEQNGVPIGALLTLDETLQTDQIAARQAIIETTTPDGGSVHLPNGVMVIDGHRVGPRAGAPALGEYAGTVGGGKKLVASDHAPGARPLAGIKVLDMGVIVVGADQGRLLADQGADVIKVEARAFPDGSRQSMSGEAISISFAVGHRNKRGLGVNLKHPEGRVLFLKLAEQADIILSNFKPGTLDKLGLGYDQISAINPGVVMVDSSAFGPTGPWRGRMGYGPLVRANAGLTDKWRYQDDPESFSDSVTIYPDHTAARFGVIGALSLLNRRLRTGRGGTVSIAQSEIMLGHMAIDIAKLKAGISDAPPDAPWGLYPCKGDDEWCAVTVRNDADWQALCQVMGAADLALDPQLQTADGRREQAARIEGRVKAWLADRTPRDAMHLLQEAGIPGGMMMRVADLPEWDYFRQRRFFRSEIHPHIGAEMLAENAPVQSTHLPDPPVRAAPLVGEHTEEVVADWLGLDAEQISRLVADEILETPLQSQAAE